MTAVYLVGLALVTLGSLTALLGGRTYWQSTEAYDESQLRDRNLLMAEGDRLRLTAAARVRRAYLLWAAGWPLLLIGFALR